MYSVKLKDFIASENEGVAEVYWRFSKTGGVTIVIDENEKFVGIVGKNDWDKIIKNRQCLSDVKIIDVVNRNCTTIGTEDVYMHARNIYAEKNIEYIPVVDDKKNIVDLFTRRRAFYKYYYDNNKLDRMNYAKMVYASAILAKRLGYRSISVIEFGVAMGNGLLALQFHAREISRLVGIEIQVYGFDTGKGLPKYDVSYLDMPFQWRQGLFEMDFSQLLHKLGDTKLIIGDISQTAKTFFDEYKPAPIAAISVDVDMYSSTIPIMNMLENVDFENVLPRLYMYFDDILGGYECVGQNKAIVEWNNRNRDKMAISPEGTEEGVAYLHGANRPRAYDSNIKILHYFTHSKYNEFVRNDVENIIINNYARTI